MSKLVRISEAASLALHAMAMLYQCEQKRFTNQEIAGRLGASEHHLAKVMQAWPRPGWWNRCAVRKAASDWEPRPRMPICWPFTRPSKDP